MTADQYAEKIVLEFMRNITDHVFLDIQGNEKLMRDYQQAVSEHSLQEVNATIGKKVRELFDLKNDGECAAPKSWLIQTFTYHKRKLPRCLARGEEYKRGGRGK